MSLVLGTMKNTLFLLLYLVPKNLLSRIVGFLVHRRLGAFAVKAFANYYNINLQEAEKGISDYPSIGLLFTRKLKATVRPISPDPIVHCADSVISQANSIQKSTLIQAKNKSYDLMTLTQNENAAQIWNDGCFITYYLCPTDYHRVHSPVSGTIKNITHIPGRLWPVNEWSVGHVDQLFCVNERVCIEIETPQGLVNAIMVGATNVGKMTLSFDPEFITNQGQTQIHKKACNILIEKGAELGTFHMGSTVVMLYPPKMVEIEKVKTHAVKVRASIYS